jgi:hypothetical protein
VVVPHVLAWQWPVSAGLEVASEEASSSSQWLVGWPVAFLFLIEQDQIASLIQKHSNSSAPIEQNL